MGRGSSGSVRSRRAVSQGTESPKFFGGTRIRLGSDRGRRATQIQSEINSARKPAEKRKLIRELDRLLSSK